MAYYAYHGQKNKNDFDWTVGYGLKDKAKRDKVQIGSRVFIIQKIDGAKDFKLCGIFEVTSHYDDSSNANTQYRFELENITKLTPPYLTIDAEALSEELPIIEGGLKNLSNFQKHFCVTGASFQKELTPEVENILLGLLNMEKPSLKHIEDEFREQVEVSSKSTSKERRKRLKMANPKPTKKVVEVQIFNRNPDVVAEVLERADGHCEQCNKKAPFKRKTDRTPYLEVHHIIPLAENGDDTVENAIALCPNCHRKAHYG